MKITSKSLILLCAVSMGCLTACKIGKAEQQASDDKNENLSLPFLVVDLDGDGIELIPLEESEVYFDVDGDGLAERTSWVNPDDGILFLISREDILKNSQYELLMTYVGQGIKKLQSHDLNRDDLFDKKDQIDFYDKKVWPIGFRLWTDKNKNGFPELGERNLNLTDNNFLESISLTFKQENHENLDSNHKIDGAISLKTKNAQYQVFQVRFRYEDSNVLWKSFCENLSYGGANTGSKDQVRCIEQGYDPYAQKMKQKE